jgi:hypothetical protein
LNEKAAVLLNSKNKLLPIKLVWEKYDAYMQETTITFIIKNLSLHLHHDIYLDILDIFYKCQELVIAEEFPITHQQLMEVFDLAIKYANNIVFE